MVNDTVVCPARTVAVVGTVAELVLLLLKLRTHPPVGAGEVRVTVPATFCPAATEETGVVNVNRPGGSTVTEFVRVTSPSFSVRVTTTFVVVVVVVQV